MIPGTSRLSEISKFNGANIEFGFGQYHVSRKGKIGTITILVPEL